jgi:phage-related tail protein
VADEKKLNTAALRKAFKKLDDRITRLEDRDKAWDELLNILEYLKNVQAKIDRYSNQVDIAIPRMVAAEAQLGRASANHDKLWGLLGENAHSIVKLREMLVDESGGPSEQMRDAKDASPEV